MLLNYEVDPDLLLPLVPRGTELDRWDGAVLASLIGFRFTDTTVRGIPVPFHREFEEVNLRFYVRRERPDGMYRRGVVFIRELVPRRAVAWIARLAYGEPYVRVPMDHRIDRPQPTDPPRAVSYGWRHEGTRCELGGRIEEPPSTLTRPSEAEFITEHYWGYTRRRDGTTNEYRVTHPSWRVAPLRQARFTGDASRIYGEAWSRRLSEPPRSAFYAEGSEVAVFPGARIA